MEEAEKKFFDAVSDIVKNYPDYEKPFFRTDGDLVIPLNASLKKNREAHRKFANAFSEMMKRDASKKPKSKAWV